MKLSSPKVMISVFLLVSLAIFGCQSSEKLPRDKGAGKSSLIPASVFSQAPIDNLSTLLEAKTHANENEEVAFSAIIGGRVDPFIADSSVMLVADNSLPLCNDGCKAPWDACCETPKDRLRLSATVQITDEKGKVFKEGLKGKNGLRAGARVQIAGRVKRKANGVFLVTAHQIKVEP